MEILTQSGGGAGISASYKSLDFNILFETAQGGDISQGTKSVLYNFGTHEDVGKEITLTETLKNVNGVSFPAGTTVRVILEITAKEMYCWMKPGIPPVELALAQQRYVNFHWRCKLDKVEEVSLGYTLSTPSFKRATKFSSMRFSLTGRNIFLWTDIVGFDPEVNQSGVNNGFGQEYFTNPSTRSWLFTVKLNF